MLLLADALRRPVEACVSAHLGRAWHAAETHDRTEFASHPAAVLSDGDCPVFVKFSAAANGRAQFEAELAGLRLLTDRSGVRTPTPIGIVTAEAGGALLVLEAVAEIERGPAEWWAIGHALAHIHAVTSDQCGLETNNYFGPFAQDNTPSPDWPTFYLERRLRAYLQTATDAKHVPPALVRQIERLSLRLPTLAGPAVTPSLLHGDAHHHNFISTAPGPVAIDPAVHYGHPEYDLALVDYFEAAPPDLWAGYQAIRPMDPGFAERRDLWRIAAWLAVVTVSPDYLDQLTAAVGKYA